MIKEPRPAPKSPVAKLLLNGIRSRIVVSHVRLASQGKAMYVNTHPFVRKLRDREWVFAHNGDVSGIMRDPEFKLEYYFPVGETDSEHAFCYIMDGLRGLGDGVSSVVEVSRVVWAMAKEIGGYGKFNFLLSDGVHLYAYMNRSGTLHYLLRHPPHGGYARLIDGDFEVRLEEVKARDEFAALIATKPLTSENWEPFEPGSLYVFSDGGIVLRVNSRGELEHALSIVEVRVLEYVRASPHSVRLKEISSELGLDVSETCRVVEGLIAKGFLMQDSRIAVPPSHPEARFYTDPRRRGVVDALIVRGGLDSSISMMQVL